jgi:hypothetical protein
MQVPPVVEFLKNLALQIWAFDGVKFIVAHVAVNFVVAVAAALRTGQFELTRLAEFLLRKLMPYVLVYTAAKIFGESIGLSALAPAAWAIITATLLGDLAGNLTLLGIKLPDPILNLLPKSLNPKG